MEPETQSQVWAQAPWTQAQVDSLNRYQYESHGHPFECPYRHGREHLLIATVDGWRCPNCPYTQDWAHHYMADGSWIAYRDQLNAGMGGLMQFGTMPEVLPKPYGAPNEA